jgi:hypothetical protein
MATLNIIQESPVKQESRELWYNSSPKSRTRGGWKVRVFLFLYPIHEYVEAIMGSRLKGPEGCPQNRINQIINARYRRRGFKVVWVFFGVEGREDVPETERMCQIFTREAEDLVISSGISFNVHVRQRRYPRLRHIFDQLPKPLKEVVVGGFHQWDCVDSIAGYIWKRGIPCQVDEDMTEVCLFRSTYARTPLIRRRGDSTLTRLMREERTPIIEFVREGRKKKPWFEQI